MLRRPDIDHILRAAAVITDHARFVVVGTGAVIIIAAHSRRDDADRGDRPVRR
jgi:hypothetical protein